jgi:hypothetical protein
MLEFISDEGNRKLKDLLQKIKAEGQSLPEYSESQTNHLKAQLLMPFNQMAVLVPFKDGLKINLENSIERRLLQEGRLSGFDIRGTSSRNSEVEIIEIRSLDLYAQYGI